MADAARLGRGTEDRRVDRKGVPGDDGNPGTFVRNEVVGGAPYARYRADRGTWVSASMKQVGWDKIFGPESAYGAYLGFVQRPDGSTLATPDKIRPGQEYLVPLPVPETPRKDPPAAAASPRPPARTDEQLSQVLDFLTGRSPARKHRSDPPDEVPVNAGRRFRFFQPGILPPSPVFRDEENEIRRWVYDACRYNDVPVVVMAVILQQENGPSSGDWRRRAQATERALQTTGAQLDEWIGVVPDKFAGGSTGIANLSRATLRRAAAYLVLTYRRPPIPDRVRAEKGDPLIAGIDVELDLYYMSALLRQLIDARVSPGHAGNISDEQLRLVAQDYNGRGRDAVEYGRKALSRLVAARNGEAPLYFLGSPPGRAPFELQLESVRGFGF